MIDLKYNNVNALSVVFLMNPQIAFSTSLEMDANILLKVANYMDA
jgi:hypothetical protein